MRNFNYNETCVYYCKGCNKIYNSCYELSGVNMCRTCFSDVKVLQENEVKPFIRKMRLKHLIEVSNERH